MDRNLPLKSPKDDNVETTDVPEKINKSPRSAQTIKRKRECCKGEPGTEGTTDKNLLISDELNQRIKNRGRDLRLRQADIQFATTVVNNLKKELLRFLKDSEEQPFFRDISVLSSGSYYELVKINKPNEFDIMLKLKTPRIMLTELKDHSGLFYTVQLCRPTRGEIRSFLLEDGLTISASKIMNEMRRLVCKFVTTHKVSEGCWVVCRKLVNSPAVTLSFKTGNKNGAEILSLDIVPALEVPQGWPQAARAGPVVDNWLGKNTRRKFVGEPVYFVPKRPKMRNLSDTEKESWRISFSHIEKQMIRFHGNKKTCCEDKKNVCCRKLCLRLLKCLFEGLKQAYPNELKYLCSYHGKTAFFHNLAARFEDSLWAPDKLPICFMKLLVDFEHAVQVGTLPHFFVPECNLFSPPRFPKRSLVFLSHALRLQRESGLPLLQVPGPVPAICSVSAPQAQPQLICPEIITATPEKKVIPWFVAIVIVLFLFCGLYIIL